MIAALALASVVALGDLDDARACTPLEDGGFAAATGGGLLVVAPDGSTRARTSLDGLPETRVHAVVEAGDALWIGTEAGAARVAKKDLSVTRVVGTAPVQAILASPGGAVVLGTRGAGVLRLDGAGASPAILPSAGKGKRVTGLADKDGTLWVTYADGPVARLEGGALRPVPGAPEHGQAIAVVGSDVVAADLAGMFLVDPRGSSLLAPLDVRAIAPAAGSSMLVAAFGRGLGSGSPRGPLAFEPGVPKGARGVAVRGSARCVATDEGLFVDRGTGAFARVATRSLPSNDVTALAARGDRVAVGTFDRGAAIVERGVVRPIAGAGARESVNALAWQGDVLWLATAHGLVRVRPDGAIDRLGVRDGLPSASVRAIAVMGPSRLLVGTDAGPAFVERDRITPLARVEKGKATPLASPMHATWAVAARADGTLFIGTASGLYWGRDGRFSRASLAGGELEDDWVTALALDEGDGVFVGTYAKGVSHLRFAGGAKRPSATHLGGGYVNPSGLVLEGGRLFAATMDRLLERPADDDGARWTRRAGASPGRDVTAVAFAGGRTWVASRRGLGTY